MQNIYSNNYNYKGDSMEYKNNIESMIKAKESNYQVSEATIEQTKKEAHEIFSKSKVNEYEKETQGETQEHSHQTLETTPGLATRIALARLRAEIPSAGERQTEKLDFQMKAEEPRIKELFAKDIDTVALKKDIDKNEIRDFFNTSYSSSDQSVIKVETGFKHSEPHEWRKSELEKNENANNIYSDWNLRRIDGACTKNMYDTHKREMKESTSDSRATLEAQHKTERSLFEMQYNRFEMETKSGQKTGINEVHEAHSKTLEDYASFKSLKEKMPIAEKVDMKTQYHQGDKLAHTPKPEAPKEDMKALWSQVKVTPTEAPKVSQKMKMSQH